MREIVLDEAVGEPAYQLDEGHREGLVTQHGQNCGAHGALPPKEQEVRPNQLTGENLDEKEDSEVTNAVRSERLRN